jgi:hypothetical protein
LDIHENFYLDQDDTSIWEGIKKVKDMAQIEDTLRILEEEIAHAFHRRR